MVSSIKGASVVFAAVLMLGLSAGCQDTQGEQATSSELATASSPSPSPSPEPKTVGELASDPAFANYVSERSVIGPDNADGTVWPHHSNSQGMRDQIAAKALVNMGSDYSDLELSQAIANRDTICKKFRDAERDYGRDPSITPTQLVEELHELYGAPAGNVGAEMMVDMYVGVNLAWGCPQFVPAGNAGFKQFSVD